MGCVGFGQSADGLGWIGSQKMDPWTAVDRCIRLSLCLLVTSMSCAKRAEPIEMMFGMWTRVADVQRSPLDQGLRRCTPCTTLCSFHCYFMYSHAFFTCIVFYSPLFYRVHEVVTRLRFVNHYLSTNLRDVDSGWPKKPY